MDKDEILRLLLDVFEDASEVEGIYFTSHENAIKIMEYMISINYKDKNELQDRIDRLKKMISERK